MSRLNPAIIQFLHDELGISPKTIRNGIAELHRVHMNATMNAAAQLYATQRNKSVLRFLTKDDKRTIPHVNIDRIPVLKAKHSKPKERLKTIIEYETENDFLKKHIDEINKAYNGHCYTCVFILSRKVFENLIIEILRRKFPAVPALRLDLSKGRNLDFSVVLDNLFSHRTDFGPEKKVVIERLNQVLKPFKDDANDKAHSLFHVVERAKEVDDWNLNTILDLIVTIMKGL